MSGKADLKYEQKLVCARMAIDCLKGDKILATQEDEDKFINLDHLRKESHFLILDVKEH